MIRRPPRSTQSRSSAASDVYKRQGLDLAAIPIGDNYTMGPNDALRAVKLLQPKVVVPIHYNTFPLIQQDVNAWKKRVEAETETRVEVLSPGGTLTIGA